jgi:regulator of sirC expression with transglutaminase-like and TPR domain
MSPNRALLALLRAHGDAPPLDRAVALIAADEQPGLVPEDVLAQLDQLAAGLRLPPLCEPVQTVARLHHHLFVELGFRGDEEDYDAPRNSLLDQVLTRRRGLPILLSVVYVEVAKRRGIAVDPVGFPGHFLVSPRIEPRIWVDSFRGGEILREPELRRQLAQAGLADRADELLGPVSTRQILLRMTHNLLRTYDALGDSAGVARSLARLALLGG